MGKSDSLKEKWRLLHNGVKASIALFVASLISKGIAYITTPIYTRLLTPEQYGNVSVYFTWLQILGIIAMFNLQAGVFNNGMLEFKDDRDGYSLSMLILSNVITVVTCVLTFCIYPFIRNFLNIDKPLLLLMFGSFLVHPAYNFWLSRQRYEYKYKLSFFITVLCAVVPPVVSILAILFSDNKIYGRLLGTEVTLIIIYIVFYIYIIKKGHFKINFSYWKFALVFNAPLLPHYLSTYLLNSSDKIMISNIIGDGAVAYYSVAYSVSSVVLIIWTAANTSLIPFTYENCKKENYKRISDVTIPILIFFSVACLILILLAPEVVNIMAPKKYSEAIYAIPPIVGGVFFQVHYYLYANILYYYKKPKYVMIGSICATGLNLILNYIAILRFGFLAAGYTTLICYLVQATIDYCAMKKAMKIEIYNMRYIGVLSLAVILISLLSNFLYDMSIIRYTVVGLIFIILIMKKDTLINILKSIKS